MNFFITGSAGFIGYHVAKTLLQAGHSIVGFDNFMELKDLNTKFKSKKILIPNIFSSNNINLIDPRKWYK